LALHHEAGRKGGRRTDAISKERLGRGRVIKKCAPFARIRPRTPLRRKGGGKGGERCLIDRLGRRRTEKEETMARRASIRRKSEEKKKEEKDERMKLSFQFSEGKKEDIERKKGKIAEIITGGERKLQPSSILGRN